MKKKTKILFLLKKNNGSGGYQAVPKSGLTNSAQMVARQLDKNLNVESKVVICIDGNSIDKEVYDYKPDICVLEAIWVTPTKLEEVQKLHPTVKFIIRVHSELPFLANEGNAVDWIKEFVKIKNVFVALNSAKTWRDFRKMFGEQFIYLPNIYEGLNKSISVTLPNYSQKVYDIGCFGAIRPMKNQLIQAAAAIIFGNQNGFKIRFHINSSRVEQNGNSVLKNIRALFKDTKHELVEHDWMDRKDFLKLIGTMDIGMQVSYTESFNIVAADFVNVGTPLVVSSAISWMPKTAVGYTNSTKDIVEHLNNIKKHYLKHVLENRFALLDYNKKALKAWKDYLKK